MISRERVQQVQLARFLVADYGYRFARSMDKAEEIWLVNGRARQFPVVRISSFPLSEAYLDKSRILHLNRLYSIAINNVQKPLDIHIGPDAVQTADPDLVLSVLDREHASGYDLETVFPGLQAQLAEFEDPQQEFLRLNESLKQQTEEKNRRKKNFISAYPELPWASYCVALVCCILFLCIHLSGFDGNDTEKAVLYGAYYKPFVLAGEWWRLVTVGFVHVEPWHLFMNVMSLIALGRSMETLFGQRSYLLILLTSTAGGSLFLAATQANGVAVGLSGGLYGLMAALLVYVFHSGAYQNPRVRSNLYLVLGMNLMINFLPGVAYMAHLGGFFTGLIGGILATRDAGWKLLQKNTMAAAAVLVCVLGWLCWQNRAIPSDQQYLSTDIRILREEYRLGLHSWSEYMLENLGKLYGVDLKEVSL
jgi:rhomboid protease GluP